jgi:peptidoglycan/xylan/chitin deacetylase (PgdA/CDA1 family)
MDTHQPLPPKAIMVTFDDGYHDFLEIAWPILEANQIPALLFLATGFVSQAGRLFWWDLLFQGIQQTKCPYLKLRPIGDYSLEDSAHRWNAFIELKQKMNCMDNSSIVQLLDVALKQLDVTPETRNLLLSWDEARYLHARGCALAAHTRNHTILTRISTEEARQEIRQSREDICREIGTDWPVFAYPSGHTSDCSKDLTSILQDEGCKLVMSSIPGINVFPNCNTMQLKRIGFSPRIDQHEYRMVLTGIYHLYCTAQDRVFHQG